VICPPYHLLAGPSSDLRERLSRSWPHAAARLSALARRATAVCSSAGAIVRPASSPPVPSPAAATGPRDLQDRPATTADVVPLIYELLDAHQDTAVLAEPLWLDPHWQLHLGYLRELQRAGREVLARVS
jgi:hypothetical protein